MVFNNINLLELVFIKLLMKRKLNWYLLNINLMYMYWYYLKGKPFLAEWFKEKSMHP